MLPTSAFLLFPPLVQTLSRPRWVVFWILYPSQRNDADNQWRPRLLSWESEFLSQENRSQKHLRGTAWLVATTWQGSPRSTVQHRGGWKLVLVDLLRLFSPSSVFSFVMIWFLCCAMQLFPNIRFGGRLSVDRFAVVLIFGVFLSHQGVYRGASFFFPPASCDALRRWIWWIIIFATWVIYDDCVSSGADVNVTDRFNFFAGGVWALYWLRTWGRNSL